MRPENYVRTTGNSRWLTRRRTSCRCVGAFVRCQKDRRTGDISHWLDAAIVGTWPRPLPEHEEMADSIAWTIGLQ